MSIAEEVLDAFPLFCIFEVGGEEAETILKKLRSCPDPENRNCSACNVHKESEFLHREKSGVHRWFDSD
jgi:hypothetical protein